MSLIDFNRQEKERQAQEVEGGSIPALEQSCKEQGFSNLAPNIPVDKPRTGEEVVQMPLSQIRPFRGKKGRKQPFKVTKEKVEQIKKSAKDIGIITPIIVRKWTDDNGIGCYQILSGHTRFKVAQELGLATIPTIVREVADDEVERYVVEANIQRVKLSPTEYGHIFERYYDIREDIDMTADDIAFKFGISRKSLYRYKNVLVCIPEIQAQFDADDYAINIDCVDVISKLDEDKQREVAEYVASLMEKKKNLTLSLLNKFLAEDSSDKPEDKPVTYRDKKYKSYSKRYGFTVNDIPEEELDNVVEKALKEYIESKGYVEPTPESSDNVSNKVSE